MSFLLCIYIYIYIYIYIHTKRLNFLNLLLSVLITMLTTTQEEGPVNTLPATLAKLLALPPVA